MVKVLNRLYMLDLLDLPNCLKYPKSILSCKSVKSVEDIYICVSHKKYHS